VIGRSVERWVCRSKSDSIKLIFQASPRNIAWLFPPKRRDFYCLNEENVVAKRRNLKKEKAERNRAYARQFRSAATRTTGKKFGSKRRTSA
jgi:hypothetical protein